MKNINTGRCSNALAIGTAMMLFTMVLHPAGGSMEHLQQAKKMIMITHSMVILSIPFFIVGFWGLGNHLENGSLISTVTFITMAIGMAAAALAATLNGLVFPLFMSHYSEITTTDPATIKPILLYNRACNNAFDFIFIGASCISVFTWSVMVLRLHKLPAWFGWAGIFLSAVAFTAMLRGMVFVDLTGIRIFASGFAVWLVLVITTLRQQHVKELRLEKIL